MLTLDQIKEIIPHRDPFLFLDEIIELEPGKRGVGRKCFPPDHPIFQGHFPGNPVLPGVLILEALAQTGAVTVLSLPEYKGKTAYFGGIQKARFRKMVLPGDTLRLEVEISKVRHSLGVGKAKAFVDGELACITDITFAIK